MPREGCPPHDHLGAEIDCRNVDIGLGDRATFSDPMVHSEGDRSLAADALRTIKSMIIQGTYDT